MPRGRGETATTLTFDLWLVFDYFGKTRITKGEPDLGRNERAIFMRFTLPKSLFTIPTLRANVTVDDQGAPALDVKAIGEAVKLATGLDIDVRVHAPEEQAS